MSATSPCNKSRGQVPSCELAILPQNLVTGTKIWSLRLVSQFQTGLNFWDKSLRLVPQTNLCEMFVGRVPELQPVPLFKLFRGLVCLVCPPLWSRIVHRQQPERGEIFIFSGLSLLHQSNSEKLFDYN